MRWRLLFASLVGLVGMMHTGCDDKGSSDNTERGGKVFADPPPIRVAFEDLERPYEAARSEQERWGIVLALVCNISKREGEQLATVAARQLTACHEVSLIWLRHYPDIVHRLVFSRDDLRMLARGLSASGSERQLRIGKREPDGHIVPVKAPMNRSEIARAWLEKLTGTLFSDEATFNAWLERSAPRLRWDASLGRFFCVPRGGWKLRNEPHG